MCGICGCSQDTTLQHQHTHDTRLLHIEEDLLAENNKFAQANRAYLTSKNITALNVMSSPGSGKTTLLATTLQAIHAQIPSAVIVGDQQTDLDAKKLQASGVRALQINTGKGCHLDAHTIGHALEHLALQNQASAAVPSKRSIVLGSGHPALGASRRPGRDVPQTILRLDGTAAEAQNHSILFIENVGNLVCPALFDLGETCRVVMLSVTEGDNKPLKYPEMFYKAHLVLLTKLDLLPYVDFDLKQCEKNIKKLNPTAAILQLSAKNGEGLGAWYHWLQTQI